MILLLEGLSSLDMGNNGIVRYSIIVPVYNVEPYLRECLDSILAQDSRSEYEVIMVDDGSTDRSGAICEEYAAKYARFRAIHQENRGLSGARNTGLGAAAGEFILFLDSDDLWSPQMLSCMDGFADKAPDIVLFPYERFDESGKIDVIELPAFPKGESGAEYMERAFAVGEMPPCSACTCMFRRAFFTDNGLRFREGIFFEDLDFALYSYPAARCVMAVDRPLYRCRMRAGSITHSPSISKWMMRIDILQQWIDRYPNKAVANYYCVYGIHISRHGTRKETRKMVARYAENADLLKLVSAPKMKIACFLYRAFGYYGGSKAYTWLVRVKHAVLRK